MRGLVELLQRDAREVEPQAPELHIAREQDLRLCRSEHASEIDPDFRSIVATWLRNELGYDSWLEHLELRDQASRERRVALSIADAERRKAEQRLAVDDLRRQEAARTPGSAWSERLAALEALSVDERLDTSAWIGPVSGFAVLERHLRGETTAREQRLYARERWLDIGSAYAELCTLERLAF